MPLLSVALGVVASCAGERFGAVQTGAARDPAYAMNVAADGVTFVANHPPTGMRAEVGPAGLVLTRPGQTWRAGLGASRLGCGGEWVSVERTATPRATEALDGAELAGRAAGVELDEWYVPGPRGLEHGFTVGASPCPGGDLAIEVGVAGLDPVARADGRGVELRDPRGAVQVQYTDLFANDATGRALAGSMTVARGAVVLSIDARGAVFPLRVDPLAWLQTQELFASDGAAKDLFGEAVALSGGTGLVGASGATVDSNAGQGAAYVFTRSGATFTQQQRLVASDGAASDGFGGAVSLSGDVALVGAPSGCSAQGSAYVFAGSGSTWTQKQKLVASDGDSTDCFGVSVSVSGTTAIVGSLIRQFRGAAYAFVQAGGSWTQQQKLVAGDGAAFFDFGAAVSLSGSTVVVGSPTANGTGSAYVFALSGTSWTQQQELGPSDMVASGYFGSSVLVSGGAAIIGADQSTVGSNALQGAAYTFVQSGSTWTQQQKLVASDGAANDLFGTSVALSGSVAMVGARMASGPLSSQGADYVFGQSASSWTQKAKLVASDAVASAGFGDAVSLAGGVALVGAHGFAGGAVDQGAVYVDALLSDDGSPCTGDEACASDHCVSKVCCNTACGACGVCATGACKPDAQGSAGTPSCQPYVCGGSSATCPTRCSADSGCVTSDYCLSDACVPKQTTGTTCTAADQCLSSSCVDQVCAGANGTPCTGAAQCTSGNCADGLCCDQPCTSQCEACNTSVGPGKCAPVKGAPVGTRAACGGAGSACAGSCDGQNATLCAYPSTSTPCGATCASNEETDSTCDGQGGCVAGAPHSCQNLACTDAGTCKTGCETTADCVTGSTCSSGMCAPGATCLDGHTSIQSNGSIHDCSPYECDTSGECKTKCTSVSDCLSPNVCDPQGHCAPVSSQSSSAGCATAPGDARGDAAALLGAVVVGLAIGRRSGRRRRQRSGGRPRS